MSQWDKDYLGLCRKILEEGTEVVNRTGTNTIKVPSHHFHFDLSQEFPILTTKQLFIRQAVLEMMWIYQAQSNDVRWLQERDVKIWNEWEIDEKGYWNATQMLPDENGKLVKTEVHKFFGKEWAHTIGTAYGYIVNKFQMTQNLIDKIKNHPEDRRMVMTLWQNDYLDTAVLPSCVWSSEWDVTNGKLNCWVHQRSCDVPLGLPFNVTQYATLLCMLAQVCGLKPGTIDWSIKDAHIYVNQIDGIKEQLKRFDEQGDLPAPKLWLNPEVDDFFKFDSSRDCKDVKLIDYKHLAICMIAAVGKNLELGKGNDLIWHFKDDMAFFKETTMGNSVIMGRKTFESLPKALPRRKNIVITTRKDYEAEGATVVNSIENALKEVDSDNAFIIGGGDIYKQFLPMADKLYLTEIEAECDDAQVFFPAFNKDEYDKELLASYYDKGVHFSHICYTKK